MTETPPHHPAPGAGGSVKLPLVGPVPKKWALAGSAVLVGVAYWWWRSHSASSAAPGVDPAAAADVGSVSDLSYQPAYDGSGGGGSSGSSTADQVTAGPPFSSNAAWAQYATDYLVNTLAMDPGAVGQDIGLYLAGLPVSSAQRDVINQAVGYAGLPPVSGPHGYPPSINVSGSVSGPGSIPGAVHLVAGPATQSAVSVDWQAVTGASGYAWQATGPGGYHHSGTTVDSTLTLTGLAAGAYTITVHATSSAGAGPDASLVVSTKTATAPPPSQPPPTGTYDAVTVAAYHSGSPAWNSTLWGIAQHYGYGSAQTNYLPIWTDSRNADLRARRGTPQHIQPGDTVQVKRK